MPALTLLAAVLGLGAGAAVNRAAARERFWRRRSERPRDDGMSPTQLSDRRGTAVAAAERTRGLAVRPPVVELGTAAVFALAALRFGWAWELPAYLLLAGSGVLLTLIDLRHKLLPDRVVLPSLAAGALISPRSLGMGDVKLAALLGLFLGWLGWGVLVLGAAAGFVVQAVVGLALLASRRIGLRGELPFGPAMLLGAALAIGWSAQPLG